MWYEILTPLAFIAGWILLMRFILPAFGVPTCMSGACRLREPEQKENNNHAEQ